MAQANKALEADKVVIPLKARGTPLTRFPASTRLRNILEWRKCTLARDLHGLSFSECMKWRNCGRKTVTELREMVRLIQRGHKIAAGNANVLTHGLTPPFPSGSFFIPRHLQSIDLQELPMSVRLKGLIETKKMVRLGDLHDVPIRGLMAIGNCGQKTIAELVRLVRRAAAGEFSLKKEAFWNPAEMMRLLNTLVADLPKRNQKILLARLGGSGNYVPTLEEVGARFQLTRERVRQVVQVSVDRIRNEGSVRLNQHLEQLENFCVKNVCPATPGLIKKWLKSSPAKGLFSLEFYVRLLAELKPTLPAWPAGQDTFFGMYGPNSKLERGLEALLTQGFKPLPLATALARLRAQGKLRKTEAAELLTTLQYSPRFTVEFLKPEAPVVFLRED